MQRSARRGTAVLALVALGLAACGGDDDTTAPSEVPATEADPTGSPAPVATEPTATDAPSTDAPSTDAPSTDAPSTDAPSTDAPADSAPTSAPGGSEATGPADESLEPFRIGWANLETGTPSFPDATDGALAAVDYINAELNGINGHPVELVVCGVDATPETNQTCGQQFANDDEMSLVTLGLDVNAGPFYAALGGKPLVGSVPLTPADFNVENGVFYTGGSPALQIGAGEYVKTLDVSRVVYFHEDNATGVSASELFASAFDGTDIEVTTAAIPATGDVLAPLTQADAVGADLVIVALAACLPVAEALQTLGAEGQLMTFSSCVNAQNLEQRPDLFEGWLVASFAKLLTVAEGVDEETDVFRSTYPEYSPAGATTPGLFSEKGWGLLISVQAALDDLSADDLASQEAIFDAVSTYTGPVNMGTATISCPGPEGYTSICAFETVQYRIVDGVPQPL